MPTVKAHYDGKVFVPDEPVDAPVGTSVEVELPQTLAASRPKRKLGGLEGLIAIPPDFDAPLEDFKEYME